MRFEEIREPLELSPGAVITARVVLDESVPLLGQAVWWDLPSGSSVRAVITDVRSLDHGRVSLDARVTRIGRGSGPRRRR